MANAAQPIRVLARHATHALWRSSSLPRQPIRTFTTTRPTSLRRRSRIENSRELKDIAAEADEDAPFSGLAYEMNATQGYSDMVPHEYGTLETEAKTLGKPQGGFFALGEGTSDPDEDPDFDMDDITSSAHGELEQVRELRELERVSGWDGPMLWQYAKPFQKPGLDRPLRFRYTTYLGETHPAAKKVVMEFAPGKLPNLEEKKRDKLIKLLGTRYDPCTRMAKMSSDKYPTAPQNKSHLVGLLEGLLKEAREGKDTLEDIPFDFRHVRHRKRKPQFPKEWYLIGDRKRYLEETWAKNRQQDEQREVEGKIADGKLLMGVPLEALGEESDLVVARRRKS